MGWQEHAQIIYLLLYLCHMYIGVMAQVSCHHNITLLYEYNN